MTRYRASIDRWTLYLINNRMLNHDDFYKNPKDGSVYLKKEAIKRYFVEYERNINREFTHPDTGENTTLRKCFRIQAEKMARAIKDKDMYTPFRFEG